MFLLNISARTEYNNWIAYGINLRKFAIFVAPEFFLCGNCSCLKNRGEIYNHLEQCFTGFVNETSQNKSLRVEDKFISEGLSYSLALLEFCFIDFFFIILYL